MSYNNKKYLDNLFYGIGKQKTNFRICRTYKKGEDTIFSKWIRYLDASEELISNANQREQLKNEIILDLDEGDYEELISKVEKAGFKFYAYSTKKGRARHIHLFFDKLEELDKKEREKFREWFLKGFNSDLAFKIDSHMIPIEFCNHWKTGEKKELVKSIEGINSIEPYLTEFQETTQGKKKLYTLKEILDKGVPKINWLVKDLIPQRGLVTFGGTSGSYKTFIAMQLSLALASGKPFLNFFEVTKTCKVLYIDEENGVVTIPSRFNMIKKGHKYDDEFSNVYLAIFNNVKLDSNEGLLQLIELIDKVKPDLIVFDSMVRGMEGDENNATDVRKIFENVKFTLEKYPNLSYVFLHHTSKTNGKTMAGLRGSGDFAAFNDVILMFHSTHKGFINVNVVKNRHIDLQKLSAFSIKIHGEEDRISFEYLTDQSSNTDAVNIAYRDYLNWVDEENVKVWTTRLLKQILKKEGHSEDAINKLRIRLIDNQDINKLSHGKYEVNDAPIKDEERVV